MISCKAGTSSKLITTTAPRKVDELSTTVRHSPHQKPSPLKLCFRPLSKLAITNVENIAHAKPPSCSSHRDEAVATEHAAIRVRTKPLKPLKVSAPRARAGHAPPPPLSPPSSAAGPPLDRCQTTAGPTPDHIWTTAIPPPDHRLLG